MEAELIHDNMVLRAMISIGLKNFGNKPDFKKIVLVRNMQCGSPKIFQVFVIGQAGTEYWGLHKGYITNQNLEIVKKKAGCDLEMVKNNCCGSPRAAKLHEIKNFA